MKAINQLLWGAQLFNPVFQRFGLGRDRSAFLKKHYGLGVTEGVVIFDDQGRTMILEKNLNFNVIIVILSTNHKQLQARYALWLRDLQLTPRKIIYTKLLQSTLETPNMRLLLL